jgi:hypothetical protein
MLLLRGCSIAKAIAYSAITIPMKTITRANGHTFHTEKGLPSMSPRAPPYPLMHRPRFHSSTNPP